MKHIYTSVIIVVFASLAGGCQKTEQEMPPEVARPVKTIEIGAGEASAVRLFPGRIEASRRVDLSFRVPGRVHKLLVREGDDVSEGQEIAELDPKDFKLVADDREAKFNEAQANFRRASALVKKGFISRVEFDRIEAQFKTSRASLQQARTDLSYTVLRAPFAGSVTKRFIQNFEDVQAKQPIVSLGSRSQLDVKFDVSENIMIWVREAEEGEQQVEPDVFAIFDAAPGERYRLEYKELATKADSKTQTFEVTYSMSAPKEFNVLPGMTATVSVDFSGFLGERQTFMLPSTAVVASGDLEATVWVVDENNMTVAPRKVEVGRPRGGEIEVRKGLVRGDRVVVAGVPFLVEGMRVWLLPDKEQATEREDDIKLRPTPQS
ncbi:MAG: efflux RND transporter periplasmic adaptor subunit [Pseudomonadota bacterium]|nr:MAG: efflux RND transporter periplasmic adaptor subunit [Pseudomonadota bacterium]